MLAAYYLLQHTNCYLLPTTYQVRELASSRELEGVLEIPRRDGTRIRV